jgi:hypothetical protein
MSPVDPQLDPDWSEGADALYWDPVSAMASLVGQSLPGGHPIDELSRIFRGKWTERNWRNVPGPIYGAMTDNCWVGRGSAPRHILYGDDIDYEQEFLYRQPRNLGELLQVLDGAQQDPWAGWACDGDEHWTPSSVKEWWRDRERLLEWIATKQATWTENPSPEARDVVVGLLDYRSYIHGELEQHLRVYLFWLEEHKSPSPDSLLPHL